MVPVPSGEFQTEVGSLLPPDGTGWPCSYPPPVLADPAKSAPGLPRGHAGDHGPGCLSVHGGARNGGASEGIKTPL